MRAVSEQAMDMCIGDLIVQAGALGTGKPLGNTAADRAAPAFAFAPGCQGDALPADGWRQSLAPGDRLGNQVREDRFAARVYFVLSVTNLQPTVFLS
jgi:hypothetical protein